MNKPDVLIGEYHVVDSGVVISHENKDIIFDFGNLRFTIQFLKDETKDEGKLSGFVSENDSNHLIIKLINFDSSFGRGLINPVEVGELDGKSFFLQFNVSSLNTSTTRIFEYIWLVKDKE